MRVLRTRCRERIDAYRSHSALQPVSGAKPDANQLHWLATPAPLQPALCAADDQQSFVQSVLARKAGQIIARGDCRWLIRVDRGRGHETDKRIFRATA